MKSDTFDPHRYNGNDGLRFLFVYIALYCPFAVCTPYFQKLLKLQGFDSGGIGTIQGVLECLAVIAPPIWGFFVDRTGRPRLVLSLAILGCAPAFLLFGLVHGFLVGLLVTVFFGLFYRPLVPLTDGITFRYLKSHPGDYGRIRVGGSIGFVSSVLVFESLKVADSTRGILLAMIFASCFHFSSVFLIPDSGKGKKEVEEKEEGEGLRVFLNRPFLCLTFCAFLGRVGLMAYYGFFTLFLKDHFGFERAGFLWILGPLSELPILFFSRRIMNCIGVRNFFGLGLVGCVLRLGGCALATQVWMLVPLQLLHALTFGAFHSASATYVSRCVPHRLQGSAQAGFAAATVGAGGLVGGILGGWVQGSWGYQVLYFSGAGLSVVSLLLLFLTVPCLEKPKK